MHSVIKRLAAYPKTATSLVYVYIYIYLTAPLSG